MIPELTTLRLIATLLTDHLRDPRSRIRAHDPTADGGYTTEAIIVTALLVALAIGVVAIIATKVTGKANSISTG